MSSEVREILQRIKHLSDGDRQELRAQMAREDEEEWKRVATRARKVAKQRGIDDESITRTVESIRYGDKARRQ